MRSEDTDTEEPYFFHLIQQMGVLTDQQLGVMFWVGLLGGEPERRDLQSQTPGK